MLSLPTSFLTHSGAEYVNTFATYSCCNALSCSALPSSHDGLNPSPPAMMGWAAPNHEPKEASLLLSCFVRCFLTVTQEFPSLSQRKNHKTPSQHSSEDRTDNLCLSSPNYHLKQSCSINFCMQIAVTVEPLVISSLHLQYIILTIVPGTKQDLHEYFF